VQLRRLITRTLGVVPLVMHQRIVIWRDDGMVKNIEADQSYFLVEVNQVKRKTFEENLANIAPCFAAKSGCIDQTDVSM